MRKCEALIGLSETEYELRILAAVYPFCGPTSFDETGQRAPVDSLAIGFLPTLEGFIGAFFIGLFVFSLTHTVHR